MGRIARSAPRTFTTVGGSECAIEPKPLSCTSYPCLRTRYDCIYRSIYDRTSAPRNGARLGRCASFQPARSPVPRALRPRRCGSVRLSGAVPDSVRRQRLLRRALVRRGGRCGRAAGLRLRAAAARPAFPAGLGALSPCPPHRAAASGSHRILPSGASLERSAARHGSVLRRGEPVRSGRAVRHRVRGRAAHPRRRRRILGRLPPRRYGEPLRHPVQGPAHRARRRVRPVDGGLGGCGLHVRARRAPAGGVRDRLDGHRLPAESGGHSASRGGERRVRFSAGKLLRLVDRNVRHRGSLRLHGGCVGREGVVRRAGIGVVLPQTRAGSEPCTPRRIRCRCRFGPAALALRR